MLKYEDEGGEFEATLNFIALHKGSGRDAIILCLKHDNSAPLDIAIQAARNEIKDLKEIIE